MIFSKPWFTYDVGYPSSLGATGDAHAGFSFHDYCPFASIAALYGLLCPSFNTDVFSNADTHSSQTGDALAMPHPELVAGTPLSYGYDPSTSMFTPGLQHRAGGRYGCVRGRLGQHRRRPGRPVPVRLPGRGQRREGGIRRRHPDAGQLSRSDEGHTHRPAWIRRDQRLLTQPGRPAR